MEKMIDAYRVPPLDKNQEITLPNIKCIKYADFKMIMNYIFFQYNITKYNSEEDNINIYIGLKKGKKKLEYTHHINFNFKNTSYTHRLLSRHGIIGNYYLCRCMGYYIFINLKNVYLFSHNIFEDYNNKQYDYIFEGNYNLNRFMEKNEEYYFSTSNKYYEKETKLFVYYDGNIYPLQNTYKENLTIYFQYLNKKPICSFSLFLRWLKIFILCILVSRKSNYNSGKFLPGELWDKIFYDYYNDIPRFI